MLKYLKLFILLIECTLIFGCFSPTFETTSVEKYSHNWFGFTGGYHSFDYSIPGEEDYFNSKGWVASIGYDYGFSENIGIGAQGAFYYFSSNRQTRYIPSLSLVVKFEPTRATSKIAFSVSSGLALPEILKTTIMVGYRQNGHDALNLGTHLFLYLPYDLFINYKPFSDFPLKFYLGYSLFHLYDNYNKFNIAGGIGLEF